MFVQLTVIFLFILIAGLCGILWARGARKKAQLGLLRVEASDAGATTYLCPVCHSRVLRREWTFTSMMCQRCAQQREDLSHGEENI